VLFPPGDAEALASAIVWLEGDPELVRRMGAAGRRRVEQEFSVERMLDQVTDFYGELLS
jgi:glycosyltransferase involved in cell wall biosynthesis